MDTTTVGSGSVETPTPADTHAFLEHLANESAQAVLPAGDVRERDQNGRFVSVTPDSTTEGDSQPTEQDSDEAADDAAAAMVPTEGEAVPEGDAESVGEAPVEGAAPAIPTLTREPMVPLSVQLGETALDGVPDMSVTFKGPGGKERTEPLDKVVRLAMDGIYSEQREQRYRAIEQDATDAKAQLAEFDAAIRERDALLESLLADEGRYLAEKDAWDRQHTPEAQAQRYRQELAEMRQSQELQQIAQAGEAYFTQTLTPALDTIASALPMVAAEELVARVTLEVNRLQGGRGYLTPQQHAEVSRFVLDDLTPWAQQLHTARESKYAERFTPKPTAPPTAAAEVAAAKADAQKAQATAQKAKSQVAKAIKPIGKAAPDAPRPKRTPVNTDEAMDDAVEDAVRAALGG